MTGTVDYVLGTVALIGTVDVVDVVDVLELVEVVEEVDVGTVVDPGTVAEPGTVVEPGTVGLGDVVVAPTNVVPGIVVPGAVVPTTTVLTGPATLVELATGLDTTGMVEGNVDATTVVGGDDGTGANKRGKVTKGATATTPPDGRRRTVPRCPISGNGCPPNTTGSSPLDNPPPTGTGLTTGSPSTLASSNANPPRSVASALTAFETDTESLFPEKSSFTLARPGPDPFANESGFSSFTGPRAGFFSCADTGFACAPPPPPNNHPNPNGDNGPDTTPVANNEITTIIVRHRIRTNKVSLP